MGMPHTEDDGEGSPDTQAKSNFTVGYRKPPVEHRFKPGNKANPRGRKAGSRNRTLVIEEVLLELITVREGDKVKTMSVLQAVLKKTANKALTGDHKAALTIIGIAQKEGLLTPKQNEEVEENLSDNDKAILADLERRLDPSLRQQPSRRVEGGVYRAVNRRDI